MKSIILKLIRVFKRPFIQNMKVNYFIKGQRNKNSLINCFGAVSLSIKKNCVINIQNGNLLLNAPMRVREPFVGQLEMANKTVINVKDTFVIHSGFHIILQKNSKLNLGSGYINRFLKIRCHDEITIGNNVAISENVTIWDTDAHQIIGKESEMTKPVKIGNHVWIGTNAIILKGSEIGDGCIVAAGAVVSGKFPNHSLIGGIPAKVIRENVSWK